MKDWIRRLSWVPAGVMMAVIFMFSAKNAERSEEQSGAVVRVVLNMAETFVGSEYRSELMANHSALAGIEAAVRKSAHAAEYAMLAVCVGFYIIVSTRFKKGWQYYAAVIGLCALYAATDEFHQLFVDGRSAQVSDVCIDTTGAAVGAALLKLAAGRKLKEWFKEEPARRTGGRM